MQAYTKELRLNKADEFSSVFILRKTKNGQWLKIHYKPNGLLHSRLGIVVSKKNHKRSNKRNYMKRVIRELFRLEQSNWGGHDIIVRVNRFFTQDDFVSVKEEFIRLTGKFLRQEECRIATATPENDNLHATNCKDGDKGC